VNKSTRDNWEDESSCIMNMIGFAVGLSNVWRFPYLCFTNGGGAFLIPYFFFLVVCAFPTLYMEVIVGQFTQSGMINVWKLVPMFQGLFIASICCYSNPICQDVLINGVISCYRCRDVSSDHSYPDRNLSKCHLCLVSPLLC
jgi:hypothetical protein